MAINTVKNYLNFLGVNTGAYRIHIDFESGLTNTSYYGLTYRLNPFGSINSITNSGLLNSNSFARFSGIEGLDNEFSTHFFAVSKNNREDGVLFSNFGGTGLYSGYTIGINNANKLYFETWTNTGPMSRSFTPTLANKNVLAVSKNSDIINFYLLNQNTKDLIFETYNVGDYILPSDSWFLGTCTGNLSYQNSPNFSGYLDEYLYFNEVLSPEDVGGIMSGFYQRFNPVPFSFLLTGYNSYTTGYVVSGNPSGLQYQESGFNFLSGNLAYDTGNAFSFYDLGLLTGFSELVTPCSGTLFIYKYLNLTGVLENDTFIPLTGELISLNQVTGFTSGAIAISGSFTGITGYLTGIYPIFTGITGSQTILSGYTVDNCGNLNGVYTTTNISGVLSGISVIPVTGLITTGIQESSSSTTDSLFNISFVFGSNFYTDDSYILSLGRQGTNYLRNIDNGDFHEIYLPNTHNLFHINKSTLFNPLESGFGLSDSTSVSGCNAFLNGQAQLCSGAALSGDLYNNILVISGDYFISGIDLAVGNYDQLDTFFYDLKTGVRQSILKTTGIIQPISAVNNDIFLNGQKLRSGIDYTGLNTITILDSALLEISGTLYSFPRIEGVRHTGLTFSTSLLSSYFANNTSQIYLNGQRQQLNNDYIEISNVDLLTGSGNFFNNQFGIYNNQGNFWL